MTTTAESIRRRLRPGELDRLARTITHGHTDTARLAAAAILRLLATKSPSFQPPGTLAQPSPGALPPGVRRVAFSEALAEVRARAAAGEAAWAAFERDTLGVSSEAEASGMPAPEVPTTSQLSADDAAWDAWERETFGSSIDSEGGEA